jgi:hypothetical protein
MFLNGQVQLLMKQHSHLEDTRQLWNYNCKITKEIHIRQFGLTYLDIVDRHNTLHWQQRTS